MNIFGVLRVAPKVRPQQRLPYDVLPDLYAFVDVTIGADRTPQSTSIDAIGVSTFSTRPLPGLRVGSVADFAYTNTVGTFRFSTACAGLDPDQAHFRMPAAVTTIATFGAKRSAVRVDTLLPVDWRYALGGQGNGEFVKASMSDLSLGGAALVVGRGLNAGTQVEIRFTLKTSSAPLVVLSEVVRGAKIETSGKNSAGLRFLNVDRAHERAIDEFIKGLQASRRERGVV